MDVVIYARFSSHNQNEQSIEGQIKYCEEYAKRNNYNIIHTYIDEAKSGTSDSREQFQQMIEDSSKKQFKGILVYQLDRFSRNRYDSAIYKNRLKKNDVKVLSARENISDDASGILMESVLEGMAEYYSAELGQKVIRGMDINASKGFYNGGPVPIGLKLKTIELPLGVNGKMICKKQFDIDTEKAPIIQKMFDMYMNDNTMVDVIHYLKKKGIKTTKGKDFGKSSVRAILTNKKYITIYEYNGKEIKGVIPRVIEDDVFYKVQEKLAKNREAPSRAKAKIPYLLTTKLFCGTCGEMMTGISGTSQNREIHHYYTCKGRKEHNCNRKNVKKDYIEDLIVKLARESLTEENIEEIANAVYKTASKKQDSTRVKQLQREILKLQKGRDNLFDSLKVCTDNDVRQTIFEEISKMEQQRKELEFQIKEEESNIYQISEKDVITFLKGLKNGENNSIRYKQMIINILIYRVYLYDTHITIVYSIQNDRGERITKDIPTINEMKKSFENQNSSFLDYNDEP